MLSKHLKYQVPYKGSEATVMSELTDNGNSYTRHSSTQDLFLSFFRVAVDEIKTLVAKARVGEKRYGNFHCHLGHRRPAVFSPFANVESCCGNDRSTLTMMQHEHTCTLHTKS